MLAGARGIRTQPPLLGEQSRAVLQELGYAEAEIAALVSPGVVKEHVA